MGTRTAIPRAVLTLAVALRVAASALAAEPSRPNVLFILTEDQGAHLGALGTPGVKTPQLDALAARGALFRRAYVGYPVCSASKACLYTGLYPHCNGLRNNTNNYLKPAAKLSAAEQNAPPYRHVRIRSAGPTLVEVLQRAGYQTAIAGKLHVSPNERFPYDLFFPPAEKEPLKRLAAAAAAKGKPWFFFDNRIASTHRPFVDSEKQPIGVDPAAVVLPGHLPDTPVVRRDWAEYLNGVQLADAALGRVLAELDATGQAAHTIVLYMGDHGPAYPHGKMTPYHLGLHVPLMIRLPGAKAGVVSDALVHEIDLLPTLLDVLGLACDAPLQGRSLRALVEDRPGAQGREFIFSEVTGRWLDQTTGTEERSVISERYQLIVRSRLSEHRQVNADLRDWKTWRNRVYDEIVRLRNEYPEPYRILREMDPAKLGGMPPAIELYDLEADPDQLRNLAASSEHREPLRRLFAALQEWSVQTQDSTALLPPLPEP